MDTPRTEVISNLDWERLWAPYDARTYEAVMALIRPEDVVLDIGAGDLRLARQAAEIAFRVEAIEIQGDQILESSRNGLPGNLVVHLGDARTLPFPSDITLAILLMRHCTHYPLYVQKLRQIGCQRLITNARWRMGVELVQLDLPRGSYSNVEIGWYACECGAVGFKPGPSEKITPQSDLIVHEVLNCPNCQGIVVN